MSPPGPWTPRELTRSAVAETCLNICFHGIGSPARDLEDGEAPYWVGRETFLRVLDEVATWPRVALSFDDGNASDIEIGLPALKDRGLQATFFVLAARLDQPGSLSRDAVRELHTAGMTMGSHGMDAPPVARYAGTGSGRRTGRGQAGHR